MGGVSGVGGAGASAGYGGRAAMPRLLVWARAGLFVQAGLSLLGVLAVWLGVDGMSARLAGMLAFAMLPGVVGLVLCRAMWERGRWVPWLVLGVQVWWAWRSLGFLADGSWRGVTQLFLPVATAWLITRPQVREWFALAPEARAVRPEFSLPHMMTWRRDRGQTSTEYVGMLVVVVAVIGSLVTAGFTTEIGRSVGAGICRAIGADCGDAGAGGDTGSPQADDRNDSADPLPQDEPVPGGQEPQGEAEDQPEPEPEPEKKDGDDRNALEKGLDWFGDEVVDPVVDTGKEFGGGVKDKVVEEYYDGPKQLIEGLADDPLGTGKKLATGVVNEVKRPFVETYDACKTASGSPTAGNMNSCGWKIAGRFSPIGAVDLIVDDDVKQSVADGNWARAGGQFMYNGVTTVLPFMKVGKGFSLINKIDKKLPDDKTKDNEKPDPDAKDKDRDPAKCPTGGAKPSSFTPSNGSTRPYARTYHVLAGKTPVLVHNSNCDFKMGVADEKYDKHVLGLDDSGNPTRTPDMPEYDTPDGFERYVADAKALMCPGNCPAAVREAVRSDGVIIRMDSQGRIGMRNGSTITTYFRPDDPLAYFTREAAR